ncbi:MAG: 16S rRNA (guanine(527)-N(7))-methyltransferase RsmG [Gammaproteobacteria bacterium]|nr:16S rRNA (guanine(527)-N(7))-methyltransferase RsmG [Gammaproteobacteria bacterium]
MNDMSLLDEGLTKLGVHCGAEEKQQLLDFVELLIKWNRVYNLTSIKDRRQIIIRHLFDSFSLVAFIKQYLCSGLGNTASGNDVSKKRIIDVGSGAGLPGLPLAIIFPQYEFVLLDSNTKKTRFIVQASSDLGLKNTTIESNRSQDFRTDLRFDCIISRALSSLSDIVAMTAHLCVKNGLFMIMKGTFPTQELETLTDEVIVRFIESVDVPGLDAERHIVCLQAKSL